MDDREIVWLFLARDEAAIKAAGEKYRSYLMKIAENITGSREDAEECLNDALLKAWETIPPMQPEMLSTYLGKLTRNLAINRRRQLDRAKRGSADVAFEELSGMISAKETADAELDRKALAEAINSFLAKLSERKRSLFVRRYWYCESVKDAAAAEGMTESAASVTLHRLRDKLRDHLRKRGFDI
ncbi:MAG: sigma-70 family RNA polymerase sigma factor [Oscillospiraceae bacterium]|nr:sigma-70 family RNA polymerase sigma factor [Oscillospiraceae bacterium]